VFIGYQKTFGKMTDKDGVKGGPYYPCAWSNHFQPERALSPAEDGNKQVSLRVRMLDK